MRNTGLMVTIDIGEAHDIHPKNKLDVGKRIVWWALADVYVQADQTGPRCGFKGRGGDRLTFDDVGTGWIRDGDKLEFLPGPITNGFGRKRDHRQNQVRFGHVAQPLAVRYAFNNPEASNLTNERLWRHFSHRRMAGPTVENDNSHTHASACIS
jgi:sialate O-acetylesterase